MSDGVLLNTAVEQQSRGICLSLCACRLSLSVCMQARGCQHACRPESLCVCAGLSLSVFTLAGFDWSEQICCSTDTQQHSRTTFPRCLNLFKYMLHPNV